MATILDEIIANRKKDLAITMEQFPLEALEQATYTTPEPNINFRDTLSRSSNSGLHIIAEVKKASPSKGIICQNFKPHYIASQYQEGGASAISVLTEERYFMGNKDYLQEISTSIALPTLRKDFIVDPYQIIEARCLGASAYLLIVACLSDEDLKSFIAMGRELALTPLVEVHSEEELDRALGAGADVIGINNRNLKTFETSLDVSEAIKAKMPDGIVSISESGINSPEDMARLAKLGFDAVLIGESLVREPDTIVEKLAELQNF